MKPEHDFPSINMGVDVTAKQPLMDGTYTQFALIYPVPPGASRSLVLSKLENGLENLGIAFPWLAGHIVRTREGKDRSVRIQSSLLRRTAPLVVKDYTSDASIPSLEDLRQAQYPFRMLEESWICPRQTMAVLKDEEEPCLILQANFIKGGLVLAVLTQHQAVDGVAQREILRLLAKACAGDPFTNQELQVGNMEREKLVPLLGSDYQPGPEIEYWFPKEPSPSSGLAAQIGRENSYGLADLPESKWSYFIFTRDALQKLKQQAMISKSATCKFVSTDDSLTAFIWQSVIRVRARRLGGDIETHMSRAVDMRPFFQLSSHYLGMLQYFTFEKSTIADLASLPLGVVASNLRAKLDPQTSTLQHDFQAFCTMLDRLEDKTILNFMGHFNIDASMFFTSWDGMNCAEFDFAMGLGGPKVFRRPQPLKCPGLTFLLPKAEDGAIPVGLCLRLDDLEALCKDESFMRYCSYVP